MSRHRRIRSTRPAHIITEKRDLEKERQILEAPASSADSRILELLTKKLADPNTSAVEAFNVGLALQGYIRGDAALINNMDNSVVAETVAKERAKREAEDRANEAFETDRVGFLNDVMDQGERLRLSGEKKAQVQAEATAALRDSRNKVMANRTVRRLQVLSHIHNDPLENVHVDGAPEFYMANGVPQMRILPTVIQIMDQKLVLQPGDHKIPRIFALRLREMQKGQAEMAARQDAVSLEHYRDYNEVNRLMSQIDKQFGSSHENMSLGG